MAGRLLLIGELSDDLTDLRVTFEGIGLTVEMAPDGLVGLETGKEFQPDLVVTEILTNGLSGFELASRISGGTAGFVSPIIFYTEFYRDEKARREVLGKYRALHYFVRPFQKEALKKSVIAHFQDFISGLPDVPVVESPAVSEPPSTQAEVNSVEPQASRAAAVEKQATHPPLQQTVQPANLGALPGRTRGVGPVEQTAPREAGAPKPQAGNTVVDQTENQGARVAGAVPAPRGQPISAPAREFKPREPTLLLPVGEPSGIGRLLQSTPLRIAAAVIVVALALYLVRDLFTGGSDELSSERSATPELAQPVPPTPVDNTPQSAQPVPPMPVDNTPQSAPPAPTAITTPPPGQEPPATVESGKGASEPSTPSAAASAKTSDVQQNEDADSRVRERSPGLSIQDVTGSGRGPVLRRMKPVQLSKDMLNNLVAKAVVVRVVIDREGKVTEVTPLNQEEGAVSLPPEALAAIQQWEFSSSRSKDAGEAVKYFSLKVQKPRQ